MCDCRQLVTAAVRVCDRWDADEVDDGAMNGDIYRLRQAAELHADWLDDARADELDVLEDGEERHQQYLLAWDGDDG